MKVKCKLCGTAYASQREWDEKDNCYKTIRFKKCKKCGSNLWQGKCLNHKCKLKAHHEEEDE